MDRNATAEEMAAELRRRGYTITPPPSHDGWSSFEVPPSDGERGVRYWVPATGVGPTPLPPPPSELIHEREGDR